MRSATATRAPSRPQLLQAMVDAFKLPDLRRRLLFTLAMLVVFRFVAHIPIPGVDAQKLTDLFRNNQLLGFLDLFSGGAMRYLSVAAMGVYPYITASIILQLLVPIIPRLQALAKEGEIGRQKLNQYTHWLTVPLAMLQGYGQLVLFQREGIVQGVGFGPGQLLPTATIVLAMAAGTMFLVWLGERITEHGIGNGVSIIIFGGIVARLPEMAGQSLFAGPSLAQSVFSFGLIVFLLLAIGTVFAIVIFTEAQRRIPVQYSRSQFRGGRMYRAAGSTHLPLRVNSGGMIPLIFAMSVMVFPGIVASWFVGSSNSFVAGAANFVTQMFNTTRFYYWLMYFVLAVGFTFFYTMVIFQQQNLADTLQKQGGFVPGLRPGKPTNQYLNQVILRITWGGAIFLGVIAIMPFIAALITGVQGLQLSSISLLIIVGVVLDTMRQLEAQLLMRRYEGFLK